MDHLGLGRFHLVASAAGGSKGGSATFAESGLPVPALAQPASIASAIHPSLDLRILASFVEPEYRRWS